MLKNHAFQVKMIKADKEETPEEANSAFTVRMKIVRQTVNETANALSWLVGTYVAADTIRQIAIHTAKAKIK